MEYVRLLRRRRILALWGAQSLSVLGDRLYAMAIMWIAWEESGAGAMGLVAVAESVPYIVMGTLGRRIMDRFASLRALAVVDAVRVVLVAALPWAWDAGGTPAMLALAALLGLAGAVFDPNLGALVPDLVKPGEVQAVNGLMDLTGRIARIAGPGAAGALLVVVPEPVLFLLDAATFAVSAVALAALGRVVGRVADTGPMPAAAAEKLRAREILREHPTTATAISVHGFGIFAQAVALAMPALLAAHFDAGAGAYGLVLAATGAGALAGNLVAGNARLPASPPVRYCLLWAASGALLAITGSAGSLPVLLVISAAAGAIAPFLGVTLQTHLAEFPPAARRRLMSVDLTVIRTAGTASMLVVPAAAASSPSAGFWTAGAATVVVSLTGAAMAWRWTLRRAETRVETPVFSRD
ncbi:MFS transporter [Streptomyces sp. Amel2xC10]|uniref:MFS transporter n=1 Tax=Streptomyces sp. Amel2xC10 TaxID=1305826 RepID=UPI000A083B54|nr:MFS transporter [Streptomyces sp. Amel2xC10]SMF59186.1 Predicted arabinose efflux permease, MFS family [Streptomyces sp. Amel2xC10]